MGIVTVNGNVLVSGGTAVNVDAPTSEEYTFIQSSQDVEDFVSYVKEHPYSGEDASVVDRFTHWEYAGDDAIAKVWGGVKFTNGNLLVADSKGNGYGKNIANSPVNLRGTDNLIPGVSGQFCHINNNTTRSGNLNVTGQVRMISCGNTKNIRDIGGWTCGNNKRIKYGRIYRSGKLYTEDTAILRDYLKIHREIDLRRDDQIDLLNKSGSFVSPIAAEHHSYGQTADTNMEYRLFYPGEAVKDAQLTQIWNGILTDIMTFVNGGNNVVIHCVQGADRTATVCFLLEALLGVSESDIDADYELTSFSLESATSLKRTLTRKRIVNSGEAGYGYNNLLKSQISGLNGDTLQQKVSGWMTGTLGINATTINTFVSNMTEDIQ